MDIVVNVVVHHLEELGLSLHLSFHHLLHLLHSRWHGIVVVIVIVVIVVVSLSRQGGICLG
jgi:hypothetical protein